MSENDDESGSAASEDEATSSSRSGASLKLSMPKKRKITKSKKKRKHLGKSCKASKSRKRKRVMTSPSSGSSESHSSHSSVESDYAMCKRKGKTLKRSKVDKEARKHSTHRRRMQLLSIFQSHYKNLVSIIKSSPVNTSSKLFEKGFIAEETLDRVVTGHDSKLEKAAILLSNVRSHLNVNPESLVNFITLLEEEKSFSFLANKMKSKSIN